MRLFAHNDCWCSQPKSVQSGPQLQAPVIVSSVCGTEEGRGRSCRKLLERKNSGGDLSPRTTSCARMPFDISRGAVYSRLCGTWKLFVKSQHLWVAWDKDAGHVSGSHAISTGRKQSVELPESQAGKSTQEDQLGEVAKMGSEPLPPPICRSSLVKGRHTALSSKGDTETAQSRMNFYTEGYTCYIHIKKQSSWVHQLSPECVFIIILSPEVFT